jgi:tRNA pseudouridine38-40 synthase
MNYKLILAYDGTHYCGWQIQIGAPTIQEQLQNALSTITREPVHCTGAGRTDAGVHAQCQVAHMRLSTQLSPARLLRSVNCLLPPDIRCLSIELAPDDFHARKSARTKTYRYRIQTSPVHHPLERHTSLHVRTPLNLSAIQQAAQQFIGTHDFTTFANSPTEGAVARGAIRTLLRCDVVPEPGGFTIEVEGTGFLYKMVRNMVGTLLAIGRGHPLSIPTLLAQRDRRAAPAAVSPHGLTLVRVSYDTVEKRIKDEG